MFKNIKKTYKGILGVVLVCCLGLCGCQKNADDNTNVSNGPMEEQTTESISESSMDETLSVSSYEGRPYVEVHGNHSGFADEEIEKAKRSYEVYSDLDSLGRVGVAEASLSVDTMPNQGEKRGSIGMVKPSGWVTAKYDFVDGNYLYNRCHLIGWQLGAENANEKNLMTGTRSFNVDGMLPFENMVGDYIRETENHVLYRVTPIFKEDSLVADGVQMQACSVEDSCQSIDFNVFVYNVQDGVTIDYSTGINHATSQVQETQGEIKEDFVVNAKSKKIHKKGCKNVEKMSPANRNDISTTLEDLLAKGYTTSGCCFH